VVGDNLELGCTVVERAATEKAIRDVDKLLQGVRASLPACLPAPSLVRS
jgi:hypothetical protein